ncbi:MAG: elongation factor Ts [Flavobacteriales bacterium]|nr:elongation factor Ts [Flavobacteriales bacterium]MCB9446821.1 elongation factor Ts [Flavobacteriales bacterium]
MSQITASDVNKLRQQTGAGMMDCKNALTEAGGDFQKAIEILRKKGQKIADKRSDREANEGYVVAKTDANEKKGILIALNCETDFVAKNQDFIDLANSIAETALAHNVKSIDELKQLESNGKTIEANITDEMGKIGEKLEITAFEQINSERVVAYNHPGNKLATLVGVNIADGDAVSKVAREVAMQVAAMNPVALDKEDVSAETIEQELEIARELARKEGKPEDMLDKIAQGKLNKFYKESTLLNQDFVRDTKKTVRQYLGEVNKDLSVSAFRRVGLGI